MLYLHDEYSTVEAPFLDGLVDELSVSAPVLPGFGAADRPEWVESVRDVADCLLDLVDQLPPGDLLLAGSSIGAWTAAELALRLGERVTGIVLLAPVGLHVAGAHPSDHWFVPDEERAALLFHDPSRQPEVDIEEWIANDESAARYGWHPRFSDPTLEHRVHRLNARTMVVVGEHDRFVPRLHAERWAERLPKAQLEIVPDAGHYVGYEQPAAVAALLRSFTANGATAEAIA
jgi:pimeloyl-ACP methyl ester carboxylesterase